MIAVLAPLASLSQPLPTEPSPIDTPTVDWWAAAPMLVLYIVSIGVAWMFGKPRKA